MSSGKSKGPNKGGARRHENDRIYAHPLPLIFSDPSSSRTRSILGLLGLSRSQVINPHCEGYYDPSTRSVWVVNQRDSEILWRRGFFGKGNLSRSEPSWFVRQVKDRKSRQVDSGANSACNQHPFQLFHGFTSFQEMTSEEIREKRRADRKQFKLDRAAAIAKVAAEAETIFETEGRVVVPALFGPEIPSGSTWKSKTAESERESSGSLENAESKREDENEGEEEEELLEDMEHLQLTLSEAFFLAWNFDCLTILDPETACFVFFISPFNY